MAREMKDSGIEWIGEIPKEWSITKIGVLFLAKAGGDAKPELYSDIYDDTHPFPVYTNTMDKNQVYAYTSKPIFKANTITVTGRGDVGHAFYRNTPYDAIIRLISLMPRCNLDCRYYAYWINDVIHFFTDNAAIGQLSAQQITQYPISVLPLPEQEKIASFLDSECARIDEVISKTKSTIEEYKKLKQSVISEAVTKGIRPNREMKDSGIEWIGDIPKEWEISLLKYSIRWKSEKGQPNATVLSLYRDYGVIPKDSRDDNHNVTSLDTSSYKVVAVGDFVINKMKAWQGSMAVSEYEGIVSPAYHVCEITNKNISKKYFHHLLRNHLYLPEYARLSTGMRIGQWDLGFDDFKNIPFIIPLLEEQEEIVEYIENGLSQYDTLIAKKEQIVSELESYKKSLIYEYVTGKKEVV